ncbi:MAG: DNA repair protein RecN [Cyanobacteriota bacterium]|nr:DNA repair protein RecN [Cyanobacteriota bacterium]
MLLSLRIQNFALIDRLEQEFSPGLNVLTGETGAGKSIILDAIDVALGGKASGRLLRSGSQRGLVEATFALSQSAISWLTEQEIELLDEESVVCSREITLSGESVRSRSRVNGVLVNRKLIHQLRDRLVEITAQGQTVQLLLPARQRDLLDAFGGTEVLAARTSVARAYQSFKTVEQALEDRRNCEQERLQRLDWLQYQLKELEAVGLGDPQELSQLEQERDRLSHIVELQQSSYGAYQLLYQSEGEGRLACADLLGQAESLLTDMSEYDDELLPILDMAKDALTQVLEAGKQIYHYGEQLESDPDRLAEIEERIRQLKQICRKYGPELADAIAHLHKLDQELEAFKTGSQSLEELEEDYRKYQEKLINICNQLSKKRRKTAIYLEKTLIQELKPLAMDKVQFECRLSSIPPGLAGSDRITYYFSPNPGEAVEPLSETASGGEMSRFLLALKACFSRAETSTEALPERTLIFDEIDTGVSGKVAGAIAEKLHQLSQHHQILCVTHQPIVAAMADVHFRVDKRTIGDPLPVPTTSHGKTQTPPDDLRTVVRITSLKTAQTRQEELAQLAGGQSTQNAIAFAQSLLAQAADRRAENKPQKTHSSS